jgi:hypothetical protein
MRRIVVLLALALGLTLVNGPAQAAAISDSGHVRIAVHNGAAGLYENYAHVVLDKQGGSFRAMVHFHCRLNGRPYDGCRTGGDILVEQRAPDGIWYWYSGTFGVSAPDHVASCADSHTYADSGWYASPLTGLNPGWPTRAIWYGIQTRFCDPANARSALVTSGNASTPSVAA